MKNTIRNFGLFLFLTLAIGLFSCGPEHGKADGHGHETKVSAAGESTDDHGPDEAGPSYDEGKGIRLPEESKQSLGLELAEVEEQSLQSTLKLSAQVYRASSEASRTHGPERKGNAYATALLSKDFAAALQPGLKVNLRGEEGGQADGKGSVLKVERAQVAMLGKAEVLLELPDPGQRLAVGDFVEVEVPLGTASGKTLSLPNSAVLTTSTGRFAFVLNGEHLLRTEIKTGARNGTFTEVLEGLYEGDSVAVKPVEALYLIELRATKGGGHSH